MLKLLEGSGIIIHMESSKYISMLFQDLCTKRHITYNGTKLKTVYLCTIMDWFIQRWQCTNRDNMKLNTRTLKSLYGSTYPRYIEYLVDHEFIYLWKNYSAGLKAKTYRLTEKAKGSGAMAVTIDMPVKLVNKIRAANTASKSIDTWVKNKIISDLSKVTIDSVGARAWLDANIPKAERSYSANLVAVNKINNKDLHYSFDSYGRFHTNFTVLKKEIRNRFLRFGDEDIAELDITNSQPFFLYILMRDNGFTDFQGFDQDVLRGTIYEKLSQLSDTPRKEVKVKVYSVLFGRNMTKDYWNKVFGEMYPNVYAWIREYKKKNKSYKIIAQELQRVESNFIFNSLIPMVSAWNSELPIITIHDSIVIPKHAYETVRKLFAQAKEELINRSA